jgi:hypothetical protein
MIAKWAMGRRYRSPGPTPAVPPACAVPHMPPQESPAVFADTMPSKTVRITEIAEPLGVAISGRP